MAEVTLRLGKSANVGHQFGIRMLLAGCPSFNQEAENPWPECDGCLFRGWLLEPRLLLLPVH
jgi:hypothetical protein